MKKKLLVLFLALVPSIAYAAVADGAAGDCCPCCDSCPFQ
jgi:hypothetical protein